MCGLRAASGGGFCSARDAGIDDEAQHKAHNTRQDPTKALSRQRHSIDNSLQRSDGHEGENGLDDTVNHSQSAPLDFGVDVVVHSCTKYIGGHGDVVAGAAIAKELDVANQIRLEGLMHFGAVMAPNTAFLLERGLKTLGIRVEQHCQNALKVASWLEKQPWVASVRYPYLPSDPGYALAKSQMRGGSGVVTFDVAAGLEGGKALMNHLKLCTIAVSLGDCETLVEHPASMTHTMVDKAERLEEGITDGLIRMSVGLENADDIIADLEQASKYIV